jgi:hypothetical protein
MNFYDARNHELIPRQEYERRYGKWAVLWCRVRMPYWKLLRWMANWDLAFKNRYFDRSRAEHPERYIQ